MKSPLADITIEFLKKATILIVDQNSSARVGLKKMLSNMGAPTNSLYLAATFEEAETFLLEKRPNMVFCDYKIGGKYGLDLIQKQRELKTDEGVHRLFILVTSNSSQFSVAQAAEEDIDAYILKPYTVESFSNCLNQAIQARLTPNEYLKNIKQGKELLDRNELDDALLFFTSAISKGNKPALAYAYMGTTYFRKNSAHESENSFNKGLEINSTHYKCLVGLFDLFMGQKKHKAAYDIILKLLKTFPVNPNRLSTIFKLAILTKNYEDIDLFYNEFTMIDERNEELIKCVCAALITAARYFFENQDIKRGVDFAQKAGLSAAGRNFLLKKSIEVLSQHGQTEEAKAVLKRFATATDNTPHYAASWLIILNKEAKPEVVASKGQELLRKGITDVEIFQITIDSFLKLGLSERAEQFIEEAERLHPKLKWRKD